MEIGWQDYITILVRRRWFVVIPTAVAVVIALAVGASLPRIFRTQTTLLVQDPKIMNPLMQGMAVATPVDRRMQVVQQELLSWTSMSRLANELGIDRQAKTPLAFERLVRGLQKNIVVTSRAGTSLITLSYDHPNPELAQRLLNTVTNIYIQRNVEGQVAEAEAAIKFIESEMEVYRKNLEASELALREFKELHTMDMPVAAQLNNQIIRLQVLLAQLLVENTDAHPTVLQVRRQISELRAQRDEEIRRVITQALLRGASPEIYGDLAKALESPVAGPEGETNPKLAAARQAYQSWVERMDGQVQTGQTAPSSSTTQVIVSAPGEEPGASAEDSDIFVDQGAISLSLGPRQEQELARLRRDYKIHVGAYNDMKRRLERARMTQRLGESDEGVKFKVIEPARLPLRPISPNLWLIFSGAFIGGLFFGVCAAFIAEYLDRSFLTVEDLQSTVALPVIGSISTIVTSGDLLARRERMKAWISLKAQLDRVRQRVWQPVWSQIDRVLLKWGL